MLPDGKGPVPRELWATSAPYMNDLQEFQHGKGLFLDALEEFHEKPGTLHVDATVAIMKEMAKDAEGQNVFCACLTAKKDDLNQWRGYGDNGRGACVAYRYDEMMAAFRDSAGWIVYETADQATFVREIVGAFMTAAAPSYARKEQAYFEPRLRERLRQFLPTVFPFFKHPAFREEREFRIVYSPSPKGESLAVDFRTGGARLIPCVRLSLPESKALPLSGVYFGPGSSDRTNIHALRWLLDSRGLHEVAAEGSTIPFLPTG